MKRDSLIQEYLNNGYLYRLILAMLPFFCLWCVFIFEKTSPKAESSEKGPLHSTIKSFKCSK